MATASKENMRTVQGGNHTFSAIAQSKLICARCGGLMVQDFSLDVLGNLGESEFAASRCVQCGEVVDSVILLNRRLGQEPRTIPSVGRMLSNSCVAKGSY